MKLIKLAIAAAIAFGTMSVASAPVAAGTSTSAAAATDQRGDYRRDDDRRRHYRGNRGRHYGWRHNRGRHYGWYNRRVCRWVWRYGHRQRICRIVRYRRYR
ncbi:MAG TPA: hypothetical protein VEX35_01820 [Allosphingosinicella sp.]|nr:hypothetical protein [Allosphingosinicella sp.]